MANDKDKKDPQPWNKSRVVVEMPEVQPYDRYGRIDPSSPRYRQRQKRESKRT